MWEPFLVGLRPQPINLDFIYSIAGNQDEICQLPKLRANTYVGSGMMVDPSAHPHNTNGLKHIAYVWVDVGTISCGFGALTNAP